MLMMYRWSLVFCEIANSFCGLHAKRHELAICLSSQATISGNTGFHHLGCSSTGLHDSTCILWHSIQWNWIWHAQQCKQRFLHGWFTPALTLICFYHRPLLHDAWWLYWLFIHRDFLSRLWITPPWAKQPKKYGDVSNELSFTRWSFSGTWGIFWCLYFCAYLVLSTKSWQFLLCFFPNATVWLL